MVAPVAARAAFPIARSLMNLLRDPRRAGRKIWGKGTPDKPGRPYVDQLKYGGRQSRENLPQRGTPPGAINRFGRNHPYIAEAGIYGAGGLGAWTAADRIASMMRGEEAAPDGPMRSAIPPATSEPSMPSDFETRLSFEQRKRKKMNKQMKKLLQYWGIVNLVNPDSASDMLKIGTAMLEQEIGQMGTDRQAKIFDAIFKDGNMPSSGAQAAKMILNAGGTAEDVEDITGIYKQITPTKPKTSEDERAVEDILMAKSLVEQGLYRQAVDLLERAILSKRIKSAKSETGIDIPPRQQAELIVQEWGGAVKGGLDSSLLKIELDNDNN